MSALSRLGRPRRRRRQSIQSLRARLRPNVRTSRGRGRQLGEGFRLYPRGVIWIPVLFADGKLRPIDAADVVAIAGRSEGGDG